MESELEHCLQNTNRSENFENVHEKLIESEIFSYLIPAKNWFFIFSGRKFNLRCKRNQWGGGGRGVAMMKSCVTFSKKRLRIV